MKTELEFEEDTGCKPVQDDMDRVNCTEAGEIGHTMCGWNDKKNCPMFVDSDNT